MPKKSAGVLIWKRQRGDLQVLLVHPGGPFWAKKDLGAWSIAKGEYDEAENPIAAARRELVEELGPAAQELADAPDSDFMPLGEVRQKGGKLVTGFALEADFDVGRVVSSTFEMEWPPRSRRMASFPEVDRAAWFALNEAEQKILQGQRPFLTTLARKISRKRSDQDSR